MLILTSAQCRAARGLLNWSQNDLADRAKTHVQTISNFEKDTKTPSKKTLEQIRNALDLGGIVFLENDGVCRSSETVRVLKGSNSLLKLLDEIYEYALKNKGKMDLLCSEFKATEFHAMLPDGFVKFHSERMEKIGSIFFKTLIPEQDKDYYPVNYSEYRRLPDHLFQGVPLYVFGDHLAIISLSKTIQVILIDKKNVAEVHRQQFYLLWDQAKAV